MIRKLIISAAVLTALIYGKEASAAGPAGFARDLAFVVTNQAEALEPEPEGFTAAADKTIGEVDAYFDMFARGEMKTVAP